MIPAINQYPLLTVKLYLFMVLKIKDPNYSALKNNDISGAGKIFLSFEILLGYFDADPGGLINYY
jgi:hypothetical protein